MFTPYRIAFAPPRESYRIQLLVTQKNGDFAASISKVEPPFIAFLLGRIETRLFRNVPRDRERIEAAAFVS